MPSDIYSCSHYATTSSSLLITLPQHCDGFESSIVRVRWKI